MRKIVKSNHKLLIPKEHGSWAILLIPYIIGVTITGGFSTRTILGLIGVMLLFLSRPPIIMLLKRKHVGGHCELNRSVLWLNFVILLTSGLCVFIWLFVRYSLWKMLYIGLVVMILFLLYIWLILQRKERTILGELVGILILTLSSSLAVYLAQGQLTNQTFVLWLVNALYFSASIFYIKMKVRASIHRKDMSSMRTKFTLAKNCLSYLMILILIVVILIYGNWVPLLVPLAFVPMITHTLWSIITMNPKLKIMKEGLVQVGLALIFTVLMIISYIM